MLNSATSLSRSGLKDWLLQRVTSLILAAYVIWMTTYLIYYGPVHYEQWKALFSLFSVKLFTLLTIISIVFHGWIGIWTISTDYFTPQFQGKKALYLRLCFQCFFGVLLMGSLVFGIQILWGVN